MTDSQLVIVRGSTPLLVMTVPDKITLSDIADGTITISQKRSGVKIIKKLSEMTFDERNRAYSVFLTQAETLSLDSAWLASIQAKLCDNADVVLVSFMYDVEVLQVNNENILSLDQPSGTAYETPFEGKGIDFLPDLINFQPKINLESVITSGDYEQLINKPSIGGVTLIGDLSLSDLGAYTKSEIDSTIEEINQKDSTQDTRMDGIDTRIDGVDASIDALDTRADGIDTRIDGVDTRLNNQIGNYVVSRNVESNEYSNSQIDTFFNGFAREIDDLENRIDDQIGLHTLARNVLADEYSNSEIDSALAGKVNTEAGKGLSTEDYTTAEKTKLGDLPTSSELTTSLNGKVDKITGKGLSTEDYTTDEKSKLSGIETGAQVNKVETVNSIQPDSNKNVALTAENIPADGIGDKTVSGNPITVTDALESIAKDLQVEFGPIQEGSGDPSPTNIRPISGRTEVNVERMGFNQWDEEWESGSYDANTGLPVTYGSRIRCKNPIRVVSGAQYYFRYRNTVIIRFYDFDDNFMGSSFNATAQNSIVTVPSNAVYMRIALEGATYYSNNVCINISDPEKNGTYEPYHGQSIQIPFGQTVYGGHVDFVTGKVRVTHGYISDLGTLTWNKDATHNAFYVSISGSLSNSHSVYCSCYAFSGYSIPPYRLDKTISFAALYGYHTVSVYDTSYIDSDANTFKSAMSGVQLVYELENPVELTLTPAQLSLLEGTNILTGDGVINLTYLGSEASNVQDEIDEFENGLNNVIGSIAFIENTTAKTSHAVGEYIILNGIFCKVIAAVSSGETLSFGTNIQATTIGAELRAIWSQLNA